MTDSNEDLRRKVKKIREKKQPGKWGVLKEINIFLPPVTPDQYIFTHSVRIMTSAYVQ